MSTRAPTSKRPAAFRLFEGPGKQTFIAVFVFGLAVVSIGLPFVGVKPSTGVYTTAILSALFVVLSVTSKLYDVESHTRDLVARCEAPIRRYADYADLYRALEGALDDATRSVDLTHIRNDPPDAFKMDSRFYHSVVKWARTHEHGGLVRRVIAANNDRMRAWGEQLQEVVEEHENFSVRVTSRSAGLPVINMAILDGREVFLFISGEAAQQTRGIWISDKDVGADFEAYYEHLWRSETTRLDTAIKNWKARPIDPS
jgi:hypothetical protein